MSIIADLLCVLDAVDGICLTQQVNQKLGDQILLANHNTCGVIKVMM